VNGKFTQKRPALIGEVRKIKNASQGRPIWIAGNKPAHMTANIVMAFAERIDGGAPLLAEQKQDGRDQRTGMSNTNPEKTKLVISQSPANAVYSGPKCQFPLAKR